jgi:hypothetical protein
MYHRLILLSIGRIGLKKKVWDKTLVKFQLIVTLDKVIYISINILIVVTQPQFKKIGLPSAEKKSH